MYEEEKKSEEMDVVRAWYSRCGKQGGAMHKRRKAPWMIRVGKKTMQKRWKRSRFVKEVVLEALGTNRGFSGPQLLAYLEASNCSCSHTYLLHVLNRLNIHLGPDRLYRLK